MLIPSKHSGYQAGIRIYPGGKGSDAPPPDPRLIEAQIKSMGIQDDAIQQVLKLSQDMQPIQQRQMQFGLEAQTTAFGDSREDRDWLLGRRGELSGLQDKMISDAQTFDAQRRGGELASKAMADVNAAFSNTRDQSARAMARMGVAPNSGRFASMENGTRMAQAAALAGAANTGRQAARSEGYALTDRANNALAGYPAMGMNASSAGAGYGAAGVNLANQGLSGMSAGFGSAAQIAGQMGAGATNMWNAQANYKTNSDQDSGGLLGGIGALAGGIARIAPAAWGLSDPAYKTRIERIGAHPTLGIGIYEFEYRDEFKAKGGAGRYRGVMADEVRAVLPGAVSVDADGHTVVNYALIH